MIPLIYEQSRCQKLCTEEISFQNGQMGLRMLGPLIFFQAKKASSKLTDPQKWMDLPFFFKCHGQLLYNL